MISTNNIYNQSIAFLVLEQICNVKKQCEGIHIHIHQNIRQHKQL